MDMVEKTKVVISLPAPQVLVGEFADNSNNLFVGARCETENYRDVHFRVMEQIKPVMDENNLTIPYPQMDIHHQNPIKNGIKATGRDIYSIA